MMTKILKPNCLPLLIGSLPMDDHASAMKLVLEYTPEIPLWVQLPMYKQEGMMAQFLPGFPGMTIKNDKMYVDTASDDFDQQLLEFYEDYMAVTDATTDLDASRFVLDDHTAKGFFTLLDQLKRLDHAPVAVKGQITGPVTLGTGVQDQDGKAVFYNEQLRDAIVKLIALKAKWQIRKLSGFGCPALVFFDEPALAGFGSSAFISISREEITGCFEEVIQAVHEEGGLAGIHVCANADWSLILESSADIVSFDAYSYFDKFILYSDQIKAFLNDGKLLAWGIVPTLLPEDIEKETVPSLFDKWQHQARQLEASGIDMATILSQTFITPSCGTGSLSLDLARKVLRLTHGVSIEARKLIG